MAASHHHLHHHHQFHPPSTAVAGAGACCCRGYSNCCTPSPPPHPLPQFASHHLHSPRDLHYQTHQQDDEHFHSLRQQRETQSIIFSLIRRIDALESSIATHFSSATKSNSLRHAAARTIQSHFRSFLLRRSRTLRHLKHLASIKSTLATLKSSDIDSQILSHKAMDLLFNLDSIQGADPMIRDGKRSISRELIRFLELIDGISVRSRAIKNVRFADLGDLGGGCGRKLIEELGDRVEKIQRLSRVSQQDVGMLNPSIATNENPNFPQNRNGKVKGYCRVQPKVKKSVRFAENGNAYRIFRDTHDSNSSDGDDRELMDNLSEEINEVEVEKIQEVGLLNPSNSTNEKPNFRQNRNGTVKGYCRVQPKVKNSVRFAENGNVYRIFRDTRDSNSSDGGGSGSSIDDEVEVEKIQELSRVSQDDVGLLNPSNSTNAEPNFPQNKGYGGVQPTVKKSVRFAENGNVYRIYRSTHDSNSSDGSGGSIDDDRELVDNIGVVTNDPEEDEDDEGSPQFSDGGRNPRRNLEGEGHYEVVRGRFQGQNKELVFSAPVPVKMESRADLMKKRNALKIGN